MSQLKKKDQMIDTEIWKDVPGFPGYKASNHGRLMTFNWKNTGRVAIMKPAVSGGYCKTMCVKDGKNTPVKIHRLVAMTFIPNSENKPEVNHKDGDKTNNRIENLEWCTRRENFDHAVANGLQPGLFRVGYRNMWNELCESGERDRLKGSRIGTSKLTEQQVKEIRAKHKPRIYTRQMLADEYGVKETCIKDVLCRRSWKHI